MTPKLRKPLKLKPSDLNREGWLTELGKRIEPIFSNFTIAPYRLTCGWPVAGGGSGVRIGECHSREASKDGHHEIFISPMVDDSVKVAGIVSHELTHVVAGIRARHGKEFVRIAKLVGLTKGRPTSAMPGEYLEEKLTRIVEKMGAYPHSAIIGVAQSRRKRKPTIATLQCESCGCRLTISYKWLGEAGLPRCGCKGRMKHLSEIHEEED